MSLSTQCLVVATVLTVYGIETYMFLGSAPKSSLQQYLPFTVLKLSLMAGKKLKFFMKLQQYLPFTVLKHLIPSSDTPRSNVATVLTVYGIETIIRSCLHKLTSSSLLQQYLPFTVLKLFGIASPKRTNFI